MVREFFGTPYINEDEEIEWLIATGIQRRNRDQTKKQQMFPYWDKPELRITFIISIIHHPKYEAWSNMPIRDIKLTNDNMIWTYFDATPSISIDRVAFLVSSFRHVILSDNETIRSSITYRSQSEPHLEFAKTVISSTNVYMHRWNIWNKELAPLTSVSFENKIDYVVIPDLQNEIEQTFGFIFYRLSKPEAKTADHLWNAMRSKMTELNPMYDFDIKDAINSWIMQKYPSVLKVTRNYSTNIVSVSVQFRNKLDEEEYYIPVSYTTESNPNFTITWTNISLKEPFVIGMPSSKMEILTSNAMRGVSFNTDAELRAWLDEFFESKPGDFYQRGYYRVHYDTANWLKIAQYLNSEKYSNIHVLNRAQIINDAFHFAIEKKLEFSIFWELVSYLAQETDYIAWYPMLKAFEIMSNIFPFLDFYPEFKGVLRFDFMQNITSKYGNLYDENNINDHTKCLKQELAKWECIINEKPCEEKSKNHLKWHLANPEENM
ncbi:aminopeptidase Q-like [Camponotus floridanus]|uniref:aminopeptidase Q-like n=1 Tax=Camponotus floridanus TaxID=104421 RepID=UPI000DC66B76|nr:aminopeptidase Q-like [Camponotus floridanus]